jgi:hypothetical protein
LAGEGTSQKFGPPKSFPCDLAEPRHQLQRTWQMEKELEQMLLKRYKEAMVLEKKIKKKNIKKSNHEGPHRHWGLYSFPLHFFLLFIHLAYYAVTPRGLQRN